MDLKEEDILGDDLPEHWYYKSKASALSRYVSKAHPDKILDVGSGSGFFAKHLLRTTGATEATCVDTGYEKDWEETVNGKRVRFVRRTDDRQSDLLPFMDVLEHVDDDVGLVKQYINAASEDAFFVFTVPAFQFLWSAHDEFLDHRRRYTRSSLTQAIRDAGLDVDNACYFFSIVFPIAVTTRFASKIACLFGKSAPKTSLKSHSKFVNSMLSGMCSLELPLVGANPIAGLSVFAIARKNRNNDSVV